MCAYNEEQTIRYTLDALHGIPEISEVIVVDDGSHDKTAEIACTYPHCTLISLPTNRGKTAALAHGLARATCANILLLDSDLIGLNADNIRALIAPISSGTAEVSISLRKNSLWIYRLMGLDFVSGERIFPRSLIANHIETITRLPKFGFEAYLNELIINKGLGITVVYWRNVLNKRKVHKIGLVRGILAEIGMVWDALITISLVGVIRQNIRLLSLVRNASKRSTSEE